MKAMKISQRLRFLSDRGVQLIDPRQVYVENDVVLEHIFPESIRYRSGRRSSKWVCDRFCTTEPSKDRSKRSYQVRHPAGRRGFRSARCRPQTYNTNMLRDLGIPYKLLRLFNLRGALSN